MSTNERNLVEKPRKGPKSPHSMVEAASANASIQGYASVNALNETDEIARRAYQLFEQRTRNGEAGTPDDDWFRAEREFRQQGKQGVA